MLAGELHFGSASSSSSNVSPIDIPRDSFDLDDATLDEFADVIEPDSERLSLSLKEPRSAILAAADASTSRIVGASCRKPSSLANLRAQAISCAAAHIANNSATADDVARIVEIEERHEKTALLQNKK